MTLSLLWTIQLAPLAAFLLIQVLPRPLKRTAPWVGLAGAAAAAGASLRLFWMHRHAEGLPLQFVYEWLKVSDAPLMGGHLTSYSLSVGFLADPLNLLMITLVTCIAFFVQLFSAYYMNEDESRARYFAFLSFFAFSMTGLVLSSNLLQTFLFWELVGLTSYLLIGFWYTKPSAATAARKAFVINRLADLGFYLGILLLFIFLGTLNFTDLSVQGLRGTLSASMLTLLGLLVLTGVMGKSAQFPFHTWLPDAMEGPTPVSALIHSATMVAAGVFLLNRAAGLFSASETTLWTILTVGSLTAFIGAALATVQRDIKRVMAYSTISQLGLMVMAFGAGSPQASMFHLATHACFKSMLFLTAGAFIHHFHTNDIWEIGRKGGRRSLLPMAALIIGLASLCGVPPFAGFFSKDMILEALREKSLLFFGVAVLVSFLTVYYSCRMLFVLLFSKTGPAHHEAHHEPPLMKAAMAVPLIFLAGLSLWVGYLGSPMNGSILHWLGSEHGSHWDGTMTLITLVLVISGAAVAWLGFRDPALAEKRLSEKPGPMRSALESKFFMDDLYQFFVKKVGLRFAAMLQAFDKAVPNKIMVDQTSYGILGLGRLFSRLQNGLLQDYLSIAIGVGVLALFWLLRGSHGAF